MTLIERIAGNVHTLAWLEFVIGATLAAVVVVPAALFVAHVLLRRASAAVRHLAWLIALIVVLTGPALARTFSGGLFRFETTLLVTQGHADAPAHVEFEPERQAAPEPRQPLQQTLSPSDGKHLERLFPDARIAVPESGLADDVMATVADRLMAFPPAEAFTPSPGASEVVSTETRLRLWVVVAAFVWIAVAAISIVFVVGAQVLLSGKRRRYATVADSAVLRQLARVADEMGLRRRVTLLQSESNPMPMTWGVFQPVLLLPASARDWTDGRLRMVMLHELAHIRRLDCLWQVVAALAVAVHWFNPLVWLAAVRLRTECERACDDVVLAGGVPASGYAEQLLDISTGGRRGVLAMCAGLAMARSKRLAGRLRAIVDESRDRRPLSRRSTATGTLVGTMCLAAVVLFTGVRLGAVEESSSDGGQQQTKSDQHDNWIRELPGGSTVELIGVGEFPTQTTGRWWTPTGSSLSVRPYDALSGQFIVNGNHIRREFAFRLSGMDDASFDISFEPTTGHDALNPPVANGEHAENIRAVSAVFTPDTKKTSIRLQCAVGEWTDTIAFSGDSNASFAKPVDGTEVRLAATKGYEEKPRSFESRSTSVMTVTHELTAFDTRVIAITQDNRRVTAAKVNQSNGKTFRQLTNRFRNLPLDDIREFLFQIRPRATVHFDNVSLVAKDIPTSGNTRPARSAEQTPDVPEDMRFVEEGRRRLAKIRFAVWDFTFVRVKYSSARPGGSHWATDYPDADRALSQRLDEWTSMNVNREGLVKSLTDDDLDRYPLLYVSEPGSMHLSDDEVTGLRKYLSAGGVLVADDFWGEAEWENLQSQMKRVFPEVAVREVPDNNHMLRWPFRLPEKPQVCSIGVALQGREAGVTWERDDAREPHYWWMINDGRVVAICCHNTDLADGWERQDDSEWYAREFSEKRAFPMMMNILTFTLAKSAAERPGRVRIQHQRDPVTGAEQRIHPAVANAPEWLDLKRRLESSGMKYRSVDVDVTKRPTIEASGGSRKQIADRDTPATFISLDLAGTSTADLTPLRGAAIDAVDLSHTAVVDLSPLAGMKLRRLDLSGTAVDDLSPLRGMPLEILSVLDTKVGDLTPLSDARLAILEAASIRVADISPLTGQPLIYLDLRGTDVADVTPLAGSPLTSLQLEGAPVTNLRPLRRTPLRSLGLEWRNGVDLRQLADIPLTRLVLTGKELSDITPLAGLNLESLELTSTSVRDLSPIASLPLRELSLLDTPATKLTPLQGMELTNLYLSEPGVNLAGIKETPVFFLQIPDPDVVKNFQLLRSMKVRSVQCPGTKRVSVAQFLKHHNRQTQGQNSPSLSDDEAANLIRNLDSDHKVVRENAARSLESFGPNAIAAVEPLILSLNDSEPDVVRAVGDALEAMGTAAVPSLMKGMDHEDAYIRHRCGFAVSNIRPIPSGLVQKLVTHLSDEHQRVRLYAPISLGNLGSIAEPAVPDLIRMLATDDREIRNVTIDALGHIGPGARAAVPALIDLIGRNQRALPALGRIGPDAAPAVPTMIQRYQNGFRTNVLPTLARIGPPARAAIPMLTEALNSSNPDERDHARTALAMITGERHLDMQILPVADQQQEGR